LQSTRGDSGLARVALNECGGNTVLVVWYL